MTGDYEQMASDLAASIKLGYEVEADDPNIAFKLLPTTKFSGWPPG
ncbi:hypothetical protein AB0E63_46160 [Kribbella sp. NPDC026596]